MRNECDETVKEVLEPSQLEVERVVAAALAAKPGGARRGRSWVAVAGAVVLIAVVTYVRRERPFTGPFPVVVRTEATSTVSNVGRVMLVRGMEGRTLLASTGMRRESAELQKPHRIMISKGTVP